MSGMGLDCAVNKLYVLEGDEAFLEVLSPWLIKSTNAMSLKRLLKCH